MTIEVNKELREEIDLICQSLDDIEHVWDGKECILKLKERDYNWKQMEWMGWYFESECQTRLKKVGFEIPGETFGKVKFDARGIINWDMKAHAIKSRTRAILNDRLAVDKTIEKDGYYGLIVAMLDVEYDDESRSFYQWHEELKGGPSKYTKDRIKRKKASRYRKKTAKLSQIHILLVTNANKDSLARFNQGRNSNRNPNRKPRKPKYDINLESINEFEVACINIEKTGSEDNH